MSEVVKAILVQVEFCKPASSLGTFHIVSEENAECGLRKLLYYNKRVVLSKAQYFPPLAEGIEESAKPLKIRCNFIFQRPNVITTEAVMVFIRVLPKIKNMLCVMDV